MDKSLIVTSDYENQSAFFEEISNKIRESIKEAESIETPQYAIKKRPDGFDYVDDEYMRRRLNEITPIWNWELSHIQMFGSEALVVVGTLTANIDGIITKTSGEGGATIHRSKETQRLLPPGNAVKAASSDALKKAINRRFGIANDVYRKNRETIITEILEMAESFQDELKVVIFKSIDKLKDYEATIAFRDKVKAKLEEIKNNEEK